MMMKKDLRQVDHRKLSYILDSLINDHSEDQEPPSLQVSLQVYNKKIKGTIILQSTLLLFEPNKESDTNFQCCIGLSDVV
jgi:hypothetical protein